MRIEAVQRRRIDVDAARRAHREVVYARQLRHQGVTVVGNMQIRFRSADLDEIDLTCDGDVAIALSLYSYVMRTNAELQLHLGNLSGALSAQIGVEFYSRILGQMQTEFRAPPQNIFGRHRPFVLAKIVDFGAR